MKTVPVVGKILTAHNRPLSDYKGADGSLLVPTGFLEYATTAEHFSNIEEVREKNEYPNDTKVLKFINGMKTAAARTAQINSQLAAAGIEKPTSENDLQVRLKEMYDLFIMRRPDGKQLTDEEARAKAVEAVGVEWDED